MMDRSPSVAQVLEVLCQGLDVQIQPETDVIADGLLDSLGFVELLLRLEEAFGIGIEIDQLELDDFRSARTIAVYLQRLSSPTEPAFEAGG